MARVQIIKGITVLIEDARAPRFTETTEASSDITEWDECPVPTVWSGFVHTVILLHVFFIAIYRLWVSTYVDSSPLESDFGLIFAISAP